MDNNLVALEINVTVLCFWGKKAHEAVCLGYSREAGEACPTLTSVTHTKPSPTIPDKHDPCITKTTQLEMGLPLSLLILP